MESVKRGVWRRASPDASEGVGGLRTPRTPRSRRGWIASGRGVAVPRELLDGARAPVERAPAAPRPRAPPLSPRRWPGR